MDGWMVIKKKFAMRSSKCGIWEQSLVTDPFSGKRKR